MAAGQELRGGGGGQAGEAGGGGRRVLARTQSAGTARHGQHGHRERSSGHRQARAGDGTSRQAGHTHTRGLARLAFVEERGKRGRQG